MKLWGVRDTTTNKLVSNLTNPSKKFWEKRGSAETAAKYPNRSKFKGNKENLVVVEFDLVEVQSYEGLGDKIV